MFRDNLTQLLADAVASGWKGAGRERVEARLEENGVLVGQRDRDASAPLTRPLSPWTRSRTTPSPADRHLERHTREWLTDCHCSLDRSVRFEGIFNQAAQVRSMGCFCRVSLGGTHGQGFRASRRLNNPFLLIHWVIIGGTFSKTLASHRLCAPRPRAQSQARRELGEGVTLFERIHDGLAAVSKGDVVKLATKPQIIGKARAGFGWAAGAHA